MGRAEAGGAVGHSAGDEDAEPRKGGRRGGGCRGGCRLLGTEAEWEYAARAGEDYPYAGSNVLDDVAWMGPNSGGVTHPVATKDPNAWGLYDMSGNVGEWVHDVYGPTWWDAPPTTVDPEGPASDGTETQAHPIRGQNYGNVATLVLADRQGNGGQNRSANRGIRLVRTLNP